MAKKIVKRGEKLGEVVGNRHPVLASIFIFAGIILLVAILGYQSGQQVFFKPYLESFLSSTESAGNNICGRFGATFCLLSYISIGAAAFMIPIYCIWIGIMYAQRRPHGIGKTNIAAILGGIFLLSILAAILQSSVQISGTATPTFPSGWGGKLGTVVYDNVLRPFLDIFGSCILVGALYFFCLIVVFVDSPMEAARELAGVAKKSPSVFIRVLKILWNIISFIPRMIISGIAANHGSNAMTGEIEIMPKRVKISVHSENDNAQELNVQSQEVSQEAQEQIEENNNSNQQNDNDDSAKIEVSDTFKIEEVSPITDFSSRFEDDEFDAIFGANSLDEEAAQPQKINSISIKTSLPENDSNEKIDDVQEAISDENSAINLNAIITESASDKNEVSAKEISDSANVLDTSALDALENKDVDLSASTKKLSTRKSKQASKELEVETYVEEKYEATGEVPKKGDYVFPSLDLLSPAKIDPNAPKEDYSARIAEIVDAIGTFKIKVIPDKASPGPVITRYEVRPDRGVRVGTIANLENDIALRICAEKVRIIAPIPGKGTVGIEVPNRHRQMVCMRDIITSREWNESKAEIPIALGKDVTGKPIVLDLTKMPHALIAGATNSGKSVCINSIIVSLIYKMTPDDLRFIMVDPKVVELQIYNSLPHMLVPVVTDPKKVPAALQWVVSEMMRRYKIFQKSKVRNIAGFNAKILRDRQESEKAAELEASLTPEERQAVNMEDVSAEVESIGDIEIPDKKLPYIICIVDELADMMMVVGKDVEALIARITQLARAAGIHMIVATQRPSTDVITGLIKSNLPTRISFKVSSQIDSRTILDRKGSETLIGMGDMLFINTGSPDPVRAQGAYLSDAEIEGVVEALKVNGEPIFAEDIQAQIESSGEDDSDSIEDSSNMNDPMTAKAIGVIRASGSASTSLLQRKLGIGYGRAARIMDELEEKGIIGPSKGANKPRDVYLD